MSLKTCRQCGEPVQPDSLSCPHCGAERPVRSTRGRTAVLLAIMGLSAVALAVVLIFEPTPSSGGASAARRSPAAASQAPSGPDAFFDLSTVAGRRAAGVDSVLGVPVSTGVDGTCPTRDYRDGQVEVEFYRGRAAWITIKPKARVPYEQGVIRRLGMAASPPEFANDHVLRWRGSGGYREVDVFPTQAGTVRYILVVVSVPTEQGCS